MQLAEGVYEPLTVPITLGRGVYPLHSLHLKSHHTLKIISQLPTFNPTISDHHGLFSWVSM